jgi:agmatine deiminase
MLRFLAAIYFFSGVISLDCFAVPPKNQDGFYLLAEFDPQAAVWVFWSSKESKKGCPFSYPQTQIIQALAAYIPVKVFVCGNEELVKAQNMLKSGSIPKQQISYHVIQNDSMWLRDISSTFLVDAQGKRQISAFQFNNWGSIPFTRTGGSFRERSNIDSYLELSSLFNISYIVAEIISEGGNREANGRGTLIVVDAVDRQRNPDCTEDQIAEEYKRVLGIKKVIRLKRGMIQDDHLFNGCVPAPDGTCTAYTTYGNGGHVDAFCRFLDPQTILLTEINPEEAKTDPIAFENRLRLEENYQILQNSTDQDDNHFRILRMPATDTFYIKMGPNDPIYQELSSLDFSAARNPHAPRLPQHEEALFLVSTSYMNFLISNEVVLVPKYWKEGYPEKIRQKDEKAAQVLREFFPDKKIHQIDIFNLNLCGGGIHCLTQYEPSLELK